MERTTTSRLAPRVVLATSGSSDTPELFSGGPGGASPASVFVQDSADDATPTRDDCPGHGGAGGDSTAPGDTTAPDGAGSTGDAL